MMKNKEKYKKYFSEYDICDGDAPWYKVVCGGNVCKGCEGCIGRFVEWCEQEALPDLTGLEEEVLKRIRKPFKYIARDQDGRLFIYDQKPRKKDERWVPISLFTALPLTDLFDWIRFEDAEPWCIDDLVKRPALDSNTRPRDLVRPRDGTEAECL